MRLDDLKGIRSLDPHGLRRPAFPSLLIDVNQRSADEGSIVFQPVRLGFHPLDMSQDVRGLFGAFIASPFIETLLARYFPWSGGVSAPEL